MSTEKEAKSAAISSQTTTPSTSSGAAPSKEADKKTVESREGRNPLSASASRRAEERDVSPGTLPDGSHAQTSGDRGESYEPGRGFNRLKGKLPFGKH